MNKLLKLILFAFALNSATFAWANTPELKDLINQLPTTPKTEHKRLSFIQQMAEDTFDLYKNGRPTIEAGTAYALFAKENQKVKLVAGFPLLAWRFISIDPAFIYTPDRANQVGTPGCFFTLRAYYIPIGDDLVLGELFATKNPQENFVDRFNFGLGGSYNFTDHDADLMIKFIYQQ